MKQKITKLTNQEINNKIIKLKKELILLKIKQATKQNIKPHKIKKIKHQISQLLTLNQIHIQKHNNKENE
uniref:Large ribosomal subunit protein uL29c n=1 Tax=Dasya naccarioides TaxID=2007180 RepID=A0A1Z1MHC3_9FLOR|nr:ribosomal protein L29 [Dasya naccarioides]ARW65225.1 ribosomal protein L29 [Dasya naccarioides]